MSVELTFGQWLKQRRRQLDLTQDELAQQIGCSVATVRKIEQDERRPSKQLTELMTTALKIPPAQQSAFITFARTKTYMAPMPDVLTILEEVAAEPPPMPETVTAVSPDTPIPIPNNLPPPATPFIGRETELAALSQHIANPATRLVTIVGAGGMGKTRLALACAEQILAGASLRPAPRHGVFFVNLAPLREAGQIVLALAQALGYQWIGGNGRSSQQQLLDYLRQKEMLIIFDNFEHLLDGVGLLTEILQISPKVQILVTSRERLHLQIEQVYPIEGLDFPDWETPEDAARYTAVQLFLQSARRNQPSFALRDRDDLTYLARICCTVAGMPLALELAASWVDILPLADIAAELQQGLDLLEADIQDMPERHRSIRAAIDYSWQKLDKKEQDVFAGLSVFRGGFTREVAQTVVAANLRQLARLVSKSWLQGGGVRGNGRYQIHELLRQYGSEKLREGGGETAVQDAHSTYFCEALQRWEPELKGRQQQIALKQIKSDEDNIRAAWQWVIEQEKWEQVDRAINGLGRFYMLTVQRAEGERACQQAAKVLIDAISRTPETATVLQRVIAKVLTWQANFLHFLGQKEAMNESLQQSLTFLSDLADPDQDSDLVKAHALFLMGLATMYDTALTVAKTLLDQSLAIYQGQQDEWGTAWVLRGLGSVQDRLGYKIEARQSLEKSLLSFQVLGDRTEEYWTLRSLSGMALSDGQLDKSEQFDHQSLSLAIEIGDTFGQVNVLSDLAWLCLFRGDLNQADTLFQKAMAQANKINYQFYDTILDLRFGQGLVALHKGRYGKAYMVCQMAQTFAQEHNLDRFHFHVTAVALLQGCVALVEEAYAEAQDRLDKASHEYQPRQYLLVDVQSVLGMALVKLGRRVEAGQQLCQALALALETRSFRTTSPLVGIALLLAELGQIERAVELYTLAESKPVVSSSQWFADVAGKPIGALATALPPAVLASARIRGRQADLWQTASSLLRELPRLVSRQQKIIGSG